MISDTCTMTEFVTDELNRGEYDDIRTRKELKRALKLLDSSKFVKRDNDKFDLIARAMQQYQVDIKSLKSHMTINIGLVSGFRDDIKVSDADSMYQFRITTPNFWRRLPQEIAQQYSCLQSSA
jgi:hypothetical protein